MISRTSYGILTAIALGNLCYSCTEPFPIVTKNFESVLVIESTLTDENIQHQVLLSRSYDLEGGGPRFESNAQVMIKDDAQNIYSFQESQLGTYVSTQAFAAQPGKTYQLLVSTSDGHTYSSAWEQLPQNVPIDTLYAEKEVNVDNIEGVEFFVDSHDPTGESSYFRYTYEETYKIIAPYWSNLEAYVVSKDPPIVDLRPRTEEQEICYKTNISNNIALANTSGYVENRITRFPVRFIAKDDYILKNRYSILVRQYPQSVEAHNYYKTLSEFSSSKSPFSESQPGFIKGNIESQQDIHEMVIGFFEVSSVSVRRLFLNFRDLFLDDDFPAFPYECTAYAPPLLSEGASSPLVDLINSGVYVFYGLGIPGEVSTGPYIMVPRPCGDCTFLGDNHKPDFWVD